MTSLWTKLYAAKRRAIDRALLASMEREIAAMEKKQAFVNPSIELEESGAVQRPITAVEMLDHPEADERARIARAFGRPV